MANEVELQAIRSVVVDYLDGMIYGDDDLLRKAMHPLCMQAGHFREKYEFLTREAFIDALRSDPRLPPGTPYPAEFQSIDVVGDMAVVKVTDTCFGTTWTDFLTLIRHDGVWQIVMKAFYDHVHDRAT